MQDRFDRGMFASVLVALALLISVSSVARFPAALRTTNPMSGLRVAAAPLPSGAAVTQR